ncbi:MAG: PQQ-binding-like beta-propeller repeat protein [Phycisphaerales bacterium]|nr:PQQ-binding-like beta-propeller repeat protein [Phycisphaerales bacterium]
MTRTTVAFRFGRSILGLSLTLATLLAAAGCGSVIDSGPSGTVPADLEERDRRFTIAMDTVAPLGYRTDWRAYPLVRPKEAIASVAVFGDSIFVQETGSSVTVIEPSNGSVRWTNALGSRLTNFPGVARTNDPRYGDVFVVSSQVEAFVVSVQTGAFLSRQTFEKVVNTAPVVSGGFGVYGTATGELLCHNFTNGYKIWGVDAIGSYARNPIPVADTLVAGVTTTGRVSFVDIGSGRLIGGTNLFGGPGADLGTDGHSLFVASTDQSLYAIATTGAQLWRHRTSIPLTWAPVARDGFVYCTTDRGLQAFDAASGSVIWTAADVTGSVVGKRRTNLLVWNGQTMFVVDQQRGDVITRQDLPGVRLIRTSNFEDGDLYMAGESGVLAKFVPR